VTPRPFADGGGVDDDDDRNDGGGDADRGGGGDFSVRIGRPLRGSGWPPDAAGTLPIASVRGWVPAWAS
jgi:hypothetical protein